MFATGLVPAHTTQDISLLLQFSPENSEIEKVLFCLYLNTMWYGDLNNVQLLDPNVLFKYVWFQEPSRKINYVETETHIFIFSQNSFLAINLICVAPPNNIV